jgi:hypothetical protein
MAGNTGEAQRREIEKQYRKLIEDIQKQIAQGVPGAQAQLDLVLRVKNDKEVEARLKDGGH